MELLTGTVAASSPLTVLVDGASTAVPSRRLASYTPAVGDRVLAARYGSTLVVLGRLV